MKAFVLLLKDNNKEDIINFKPGDPYWNAFNQEKMHMNCITPHGYTSLVNNQHTTISFLFLGNTMYDGVKNYRKEEKRVSKKLKKKEDVL